MTSNFVRKTAGAAVLACFLGLALLLGAVSENAPEVVGQLVAEGASINGIQAPAGTTVLEGSELRTGATTVTIHLSSGQVVELGLHTLARLERTETGGISLEVKEGSLRFRASNGDLEIAGPSDRVEFAQRRAGRPIPQNQEGVVGTLSVPAGRGQDKLAARDASRVEPSAELVIRSQDGAHQELKCAIKDIRDNLVRVTNDLRFSYRPDDLLIQRLHIQGQRIMASLQRAADDGDERLWVDDSREINPLERVMIRREDGQVREVACVRHTEAVISPNSSSPESAWVRLGRDLRNEFPVDSDVLQGVRDEAIQTVLLQAASDGQRRLRVKDPAVLDPLQQVLIRSSDGSRLEAYCVHAIEGDSVILAEDLDFDYAANSQVLQGRSAAELLAQGDLQRSANCCCCCRGVGVPVLPFAWWWLVPPAVIPPLVPSDEPPGEIEFPPTPVRPPSQP